MIMEVLFWMALAVLTYVYAGYPLGVWAGSWMFRRPIDKKQHEPSVTILIAAYNECEHIGRTVENKLALRYPRSKLQIIVVSDGSTDGTDEIVRRYASEGVRLLRQEPRNGKTAALRLADGHVTGDVVVFADANSLYEPDALQELVANFADPNVGYVTGQLVYGNPNGSITGDGCSLYMRYENFLRRSESRIGSVVGVNGGIDAIRRSLFGTMKADDLPDLVLPLRTVQQGYRVIYEPAAILRESANTRTQDEYRMRVRVSLRALWTLAEMPSLLNVRRYRLFAVQLLSHKILRYLAFLLMLTTFIAALALWPVRPVYRLAALAQTAFIATAGLGLIAEHVGRPNRWLRVPLYFALSNLAALQAFVKFLKRERSRVWHPRLG